MELEVGRVLPSLPLRSMPESCELLGDVTLTDISSCPNASPGQMTATERSEMRSMVQSEAYRHLSIGSIVRLAMRMGNVYACSSTWYRTIQSGNRI